MKSMRILTTVHLANHGGCIFTYSLLQALTKNLPEYQVWTLDYLPRNWYYHELARAVKPQRKGLSYNFQRFLLSERFHRQYLHLEKAATIYPRGYERMVGLLTKVNYDALVVGMVIWDITDLPQIPHFPNIYWLSEKIPSVKIAYAASGHRTQFTLLRKNIADIQRILSSYALIGVRDQITWEMMQETKVDRLAPVYRVPDPAFVHEGGKTRVQEVLTANGVDLERPILGVLFYGKPEFSADICRHYRSLGYQTLALSMFNPFADVNLGHLLTPFEWADTFKYLSFCVTDRFHGSIFCLRNNIPFISIEPYAPRTPANSKIYSLLSDFDLQACYADVLQPDFNLGDFLGRARDLQSAWQSDFAPQVSKRVAEMQARSHEFISKIKAVV